MGIARQKDIYEKISAYINDEVLDKDLKEIVQASFKNYESNFLVNHSNEEKIMRYIAWITLIVQIKNKKICDLSGHYYVNYTIRIIDVY